MNRLYGRADFGTRLQELLGEVGKMENAQEHLEWWGMFLELWLLTKVGDNHAIRETITEYRSAYQDISAGRFMWEGQVAMKTHLNEVCYRWTVPEYIERLGEVVGEDVQDERVYAATLGMFACEIAHSEGNVSYAFLEFMNSVYKRRDMHVSEPRQEFMTHFYDGYARQIAHLTGVSYRNRLVV